MTEDTLILDTQAEVFVWVGQSVGSKEKQIAFEFGQVLLKQFMDIYILSFFIIFFFNYRTSSQRYVEMAASLEGLDPNVPLYKVSEGNEPFFFTTYFTWDPAKANVCAQIINFLILTVD